MLQRNEGAASEPTLSRHSTQLPVSRSRRPPPVVEPMCHDAAALALDHSSKPTVNVCERYKSSVGPVNLVALVDWRNFINFYKRQPGERDIPRSPIQPNTSTYILKTL